MVNTTELHTPLAGLSSASTARPQAADRYQPKSPPPNPRQEHMCVCVRWQGVWKCLEVAREVQIHTICKFVSSWQAHGRYLDGKCVARKRISVHKADVVISACSFMLTSEGNTSRRGNRQHELASLQSACRTADRAVTAASRAYRSPTAVGHAINRQRVVHEWSFAGKRPCTDPRVMQSCSRS